MYHCSFMASFYKGTNHQFSCQGRTEIPGAPILRERGSGHFCIALAASPRDVFPCQRRLTASGQDIPLTTTVPLSGRRRVVEKLWQGFFSGPSQWWDHRSEKVNSRHPDFSHKGTQEGLWLDSKYNPPWVAAELDALAPGTLELDIFTWNKRLARYVKAGKYEKALEYFQQMQKDGMAPNTHTFVPVLNACSSLRALEEGRDIHKHMIRSGCDSDTFVCNSLLDMYAKCGSILDACRVFNNMPTHDVVSWNVMIMGYVNCGQGLNALQIYQQMQREGLKPNSSTFVGLLKACASISELEEGQRVHDQIIKSGHQCNVFVGSSLVDMYAKCGSIEDAWRVFDNMPVRNVISWNAILMGHVKCGQGHRALQLFRQMQREGVDPDPVTFLGVLNACASVAALGQGRNVHNLIIQKGFESDVTVASCLVDMYAKCGSIQDAREVFSKMPARNLVSWTSLLGGYAMHGHVEAALGHFEQMSQEGIEMDGVTFVSLLTACNHGGLADEGLHYFESMSVVYNIFPTVEHYACVVDILGRGNRLQEAEELITIMPCEPNGNVWRSLLGACKVHGNVEIGERAVKRVLGLKPGNGAGSMLLPNI